MSHRRRILFICKRRTDSGGYDASAAAKRDSYGLVNSCRLVGEALESAYEGLEHRVVVVNDNNDIDREVTLYRPTHVMVEALWVVPQKFRVLLPRHPKVQWSVRVHSNTPFIANEGIAFEWLKAYEDIADEHGNFSVSANACRFVRDLRDLLDTDHLDYLPNVYDRPLEERVPPLPGRKELHVGCFGAIRPMKNHVQQALAAIVAADRMDRQLHFHVNAGRVEQRGEPVLKNMRAMFAGTKHHLVEHGWYGHRAFVDLVRRMDACMQVSLSETFNIVTADAVTAGVPVVASREIDWVPGLFSASPTDGSDIARKLVRALRWGRAGVCLCRWGLARSNDRAIDAWGNYLYR